MNKIIKQLVLDFQHDEIDNQTEQLDYLITQRGMYFPDELLHKLLNRLKALNAIAKKENLVVKPYK